LFVDLQLAAELGKTLLERNKELENCIKLHQCTIDDQRQEIEVRDKCNHLNFANVSRAMLHRDSLWPPFTETTRADNRFLLFALLNERNLCLNWMLKRASFHLCKNLSNSCLLFNFLIKKCFLQMLILIIDNCRFIISALQFHILCISVLLFKQIRNSWLKRDWSLRKI
jgi:hypothetical protein